MPTPYGPSPEDRGNRRSKRSRYPHSKDKEEQPEERPKGRIIQSFETGIQYQRPHLVPREFLWIILTIIGCSVVAYMLLRGYLPGEARARLLEVERTVQNLIVHKVLGRPSTPPAPALSPTPPASQPVDKP